jgi:hypothetical protein
MPLYTDGLTTNLSDLTSYDSTILEVAAAENINIPDKLRLAQKEIGFELSNFLLRHQVSGELKSVIVTEQMAHVHSLHALGLLYRDAYNSQLNERYKGKWKEYVHQADLALRRLFETGIGIVVSPVPAAGMPAVSAVPGGVLPARTYSVSVSWIGGSGVAGAASAPVTVELPPGTLLSVTVAKAPAGVTGFVVLAGAVEDSMHRQNASPATVTERWQEALPGLRTDLKPWPAQQADYFVANRRQLLRG